MIVNIFCQVDDFCKKFKKLLLENEANLPKTKKGKKKNMSLSEVITIVIYFHYSGYKNFKSYYLNCVYKELRSCFGNLVSYNRFLELKQETAIPIALLCKLLNSNKCSGKSFVDSFALPVCHIKRQYSNKVFKGIAKKGKTSMGWFFGLKVHFLINHHGEVINFCITSGNIHDADEKVMDKLTKDVFGKLFGDKGYLGKKLFEKLWIRGIQMITKIRKNMKNKFMNIEDKILLKKRGVIESVIGILKNTFSIQHTRHRSTKNFLVNLFSAFIAYAFKSEKPSICLNKATLLD
jgi:hypothetical protein